MHVDTVVVLNRNKEDSIINTSINININIIIIMDALNAKEQQEFQKLVEQKQMKDFMRLYSNLVERCFMDCVNDFTSSKLTNKEQTCIMRCSEKFLKHSERVGQRFQEQNAALGQGLGR